MSCAARPVGNKAIKAIAKIFIIIFTKIFRETTSSEVSVFGVLTPEIMLWIYNANLD